MDFDFSPEQLAVRDLARDLFANESPASRLRELWGKAERDRSVWKALGQAGLLEITDPVDLVLVLEEAGRAALPEPIVETLAIAAPVLGSSSLADEWIPKITSGDAIVAVQLAGAPFVVDAADADLLLLERDGALHAVPRDAITATPVRSDDGARLLFSVEAREDGASRLDVPPAEAAARGAAAVAAVLNGISSRMLDMTLEYVKQREQFGRPVGTFQAVKHKLASAYVRIESARAAAWYAAFAIASELPDRSLAASAAKVVAAEAHAIANAEALQCHGGIGFTWEHDLHLWMKRGNALAASYGTASEHRARVADHVLSEVAHG
ncbi:MAG: acyl-CoA dehydrogenase family protein [Actinomycetota bacterium]